MRVEVQPDVPLEQATRIALADTTSSEKVSATAASPESTGCVLFGTVRTASGKPAAGATVLLEIAGQDSEPPGWLASMEGFCNNGWQYLDPATSTYAFWRAGNRSVSGSRGDNPRIVATSDGTFRF